MDELTKKKTESYREAILSLFFSFVPVYSEDAYTRSWFPYLFWVIDQCLVAMSITGLGFMMAPLLFCIIPIRNPLIQFSQLCTNTRHKYKAKNACTSRKAGKKEFIIRPAMCFGYAHAHSLTPKTKKKSCQQKQTNDWSPSICQDAL